MWKRTQKERWYPAHDWFTLDLATCKFVFEQAEKRMDEVSSVSEAVTENAKKLLLSLAALFSFFTGFVAQKQIHIIHGEYLFASFIAIMGLTTLLIFPRKVNFRGLSPIALMKGKPNDEKEYRVKPLLWTCYSGIVILQENIEHMTKLNNRRGLLYMLALVASLVLLAIVSGTIIKLL